MKKTELEIKKEILKKLEDIENSQESLIEKIGHIQIDLFDHTDIRLETKLDQLNSGASEEFEEISGIIEEYRMHINNLEH